MTNEDIMDFDVEAYLDQTMKEGMEQAGNAGQGPHVGGPADAVVETYDSETLNYLLNNITDSFHRYIIDSINKAHISADGKQRLKLIVQEFTDKEIVVSLLKDYADVRSQLNNFREVAKYSKIGLRRIDSNNGFFTILSAIETHYKLKLTRAWKGFERVEQQTQRVKAEHSSSYADKTAREEPTGLRRMAINMKGGQ